MERDFEYLADTPMRRRRITTQMRTQLIFIEGLPGSGKSSLAEWLCQHINAQGTPSTWIPELERGHPVIDKATMRTASASGYGDRCIARWAAFSDAVQRLESSSIIILDACLFQSTVRFLVEYERDADEVDRYLPAVEGCLAPISTRIIYLTQTDATEYLETELVRRKGFETVSRIASYSESTPYAVSRGLEGFAALKSLYAEYRIVCDSMIRNSKLPVLALDVMRLSESEVRQQVSSQLFGADTH